MPIIHWILSIILGLTLVEVSIRIELILLSSISFILAWFFAVGINDYYDIEIDKITNPTRPLITERLAPRDVKIFFIVSAISSLVLAIFCDLLNAKFGITLLTGIYLLLAILYSTPPFRIKSKTPFSSLVIGLVTSECILIGGVLTEMTLLYISYAIILGFLVTFISAAKDLKDIEGDKTAGIPTIPVNYGPEKAALMFQVINVVGYGSLFFLYFLQPLPWYFDVYLIITIIINFLLFQRFKKAPTQENGGLIYKLGFSLYMIGSILMIVINL